MNVQHELLFINPILHSGLNVTIRNGDKWFRQATIGDELSIYRTGDTYRIGDTHFHRRLGFGKVIGLAFLPCNMLPTEWLLLEHDPTCRDQYGLFKAMKKAYPDFQVGDLVTAILFDVKCIYNINKK